MRKENEFIRNLGNPVKIKRERKAPSKFKIWIRDSNS